MTAENAIDYLRAIQPRTDVPYYLYVVDPDNHLHGVVSLRDLVIARPATAMRDLMTTDLITTTIDTDQEEVLRTLQHYGLRALPVLDANDRLVGVTTADDLIDVAQQEATEDMFRMVGMDETEAFTGPVIPSVQRRLPWLLINLITVFGAAATVAVFEDTLERAAVIAVFLPVVVGISANAGGQTLTLVVRAMALGEYSRDEWRRVLPREIAIGILNGIALGLVVALVAWVWKGNGYLGLAIGLAMFGNMAVAALAGVLVPTGLRFFRADPALASSIFVTSVTDIMGYFFFLGLAALLIERIA
jgi:magnesium transporter